MSSWTPVDTYGTIALIIIIGCWLFITYRLWKEIKPEPLIA